MIVLYGHRFYGKCDHLPGLFYVATVFYHFWYVPLFPAESYLVTDDGTGRYGVHIPLSRKSVWTGYFRAVCFVLGAVLLFGGMSEANRVGRAQETRDNNPWISVPAVGLALLITGAVSYFGFRIGKKRALHLAEVAKMNPAYVHNYFDILAGIELPSLPDEVPDQDYWQKPTSIEKFRQ